VSCFQRLPRSPVLDMGVAWLMLHGVSAADSVKLLYAKKNHRVKSVVVMHSPRRERIAPKHPKKDAS
jgi:hypothetical protein